MAKCKVIFRGKKSLPLPPLIFILPAISGFSTDISCHILNNILRLTFSYVKAEIINCWLLEINYYVGIYYHIWK